MAEPTTTPRRADDLEQLWAGEFGDAYVTRNHVAVDERAGFWDRILGQYPSRRVLEVGPAHGENLRHLARSIPPHDLWGVDINDQALEAMRQVVPGSNGVWGIARELPFRDRYFDLVLTVGLLIHQPDDTLPLVMGEIVRCSNRWVLCGEYQADETTDVNYRGMPGVLLKRDYGRIYQELFPDLELREEGFLTREHGFDRVTYQVFERIR
jgi:pseudaminic acid biosynthesis-associated methylase